MHAPEHFADRSGIDYHADNSDKIIPDKRWVGKMRLRLTTDQIVRSWGA
jgi:hypothetical protein